MTFNDNKNNEDKKMISNQETFRKALEGILEQGERCTNSMGQCRYRLYTGDKTLKCIAGQLIPDEDYNPDWDTCVVPADQGDVKDYFVEAGYDVNFLRSLQRVHDAHYENFRDYVSAMQGIATFNCWPEEASRIGLWLKGKK